MSIDPASPWQSAHSGQTKAGAIDLGSLGQLSGAGWLDHAASPYAAYGGILGTNQVAATSAAEQATAYTLAQATIETALGILVRACTRTRSLFSPPEAQNNGPFWWRSHDEGSPASVCTWPHGRHSTAAIRQPDQKRPDLTLSAPIARSGDLILAERNPTVATNRLSQAKAPPKPARQKLVVRQSWLRTATKSPAFALSSAAINWLMLVSPLVSLAQTTTIYGTGGSSNTYTGGTIGINDTVILNDGASVTNANDANAIITANGTLQFNQTANLTITNVLSGTGALALISAGNLTLTYNAPVAGIATVNAFDLGISLAGGSLLIGANGGNGLVIGSIANGTLTISGGLVKDSFGYLGLAPGSNGTATVSTGGTWTTTGNLTVGNSGHGTLTISGGNVSNANGTIGSLSDSIGNVAVSGGNWANTGNLTVGGMGTANLTISGGIVKVGGTLSKGANGIINLNDGGTLSVGNLALANFSHGGVLSFNSSTNYAPTSNLSGTGSLIKQGTNTLTLSGNNTYTGGTTLGAGTLVLNSTNAIGTSGTITFSGGTLQSSANNATDYSARFSTAASQAYAINTNSQSITWASNLTSNGGTLAKSGAGTLTLTGNNTYTGSTTIAANGGTLQIGAGGTSGSINESGTISLGTNTNLWFNRSDAITYGGGDF